jgi:TP901 family phage tail tape measure protein
VRGGSKDLSAIEVWSVVVYNNESNSLNNYAVSSDGIATALQDSASALMEGGNNLEQAVALVAAANKVVQDPNSVGSALRTISLRLRGTSVEILEQMGEETDNVVESTSKLQSKIQALSGVDILTKSGDYKDTYTILKEIGQVWEDMSDIDQAALLELMAGKNRANTLSAILSNMEDLTGAYSDALNAEGKLHCLNVQKCA